MFRVRVVSHRHEHEHENTNTETRKFRAQKIRKISFYAI
jgi:hypothetical protein